MQVYGEESYEPDQRKKERKERDVRGLKTWQCVVLFLVGCVGLNILANYIVSPIAQAATGVTNSSPLAERIAFSAYVNFFTYLVEVLILVALLLVFDRKWFLAQWKGVNGRLILSSLYFTIGLFFVSNLLGMLQQEIEEAAGLGNATNTNQSSLNAMMSSFPALMLVETAIFAPFVEEITYRLGLFESLRRYSRVLAYIAVTLVFGLIHTASGMIEDIAVMANSSSTAAQVESARKLLYVELLSLPPYMAAGGILAFCYENNSSFVASFFTHGLYNLVVTVMYIVSNSFVSSSSESASFLAGIFRHFLI